MPSCIASPVPEVPAKVKVCMHSGAYYSTAFNRKGCKQSKCPSVGSAFNKWCYIFQKNHYAAMESMNMDILTRGNDVLLGFKTRYKTVL